MKFLHQILSDPIIALGLATIVVGELLLRDQIIGIDWPNPANIFWFIGLCAVFGRIAGLAVFS